MSLGKYYNTTSTRAFTNVSVVATATIHLRHKIRFWERTTPLLKANQGGKSSKSGIATITADLEDDSKIGE